MPQTVSESGAEHLAGNPARKLGTSLVLLALLLAGGVVFYGAMHFRSTEWQSVVLVCEYVAAILYAGAVTLALNKAIGEADAIDGDAARTDR